MSKIVSTYSVNNTVIDLKSINRLAFTVLNKSNPSDNSGTNPNDLGLCMIHYNHTAKTDCMHLTYGEFEQLSQSYNEYSTHIATIAPQHLKLDALELLNIIGPELKKQMADQIDQITAQVQVQCKLNAEYECNKEISMYREHNRALVTSMEGLQKELSKSEVKINEMTTKLNTITTILEKLVSLN